MYMKEILGGHEVVKFNDVLLQCSLVTHNKKRAFEVKEAMIRDKFDIFFDKLSFFDFGLKNW